MNENDIKAIFEHNWFEAYKPIPITEKLLKEFNVLTDSKFDYKENVVYCLNDKFFYVIDTYYDSNDATNYIEIEVKYVHEFQNLFFALTGN